MIRIRGSENDLFLRRWCRIGCCFCFSFMIFQIMLLPPVAFDEQQHACMDVAPGSSSLFFSLCRPFETNPTRRGSRKRADTKCTKSTKRGILLPTNGRSRFSQEGGRGPKSLEMTLFLLVLSWCISPSPLPAAPPRWISSDNSPLLCSTICPYLRLFILIKTWRCLSCGVCRFGGVCLF